MKKALNALGYPVGRRKIQSLMREAGVIVVYRKKYKATTNSKHKKSVFENVLNRDFSPSAPDRAYVSDITYLSTQEGWFVLEEGCWLEYEFKDESRFSLQCPENGFMAT